MPTLMESYPKRSPNPPATNQRIRIHRRIHYLKQSKFLLAPSSPKFLIILIQQNFSNQWSVLLVMKVHSHHKD